MRFTCESFTEHYTVEHQPMSLSPPSLSITNFTFQSFSFHHFMLMITQKQFSASNNNQTQCVFNFSTFSTYRKNQSHGIYFRWMPFESVDFTPSRFTSIYKFRNFYNYLECARVCTAHTLNTLNTEQCEVYVASTAAMSAIANFSHAQPFICSFFCSLRILRFLFRIPITNL